MSKITLDRLPKNATPGEVRRFVSLRGKLDAKQVGEVRFLGTSAQVEVPDSHAARVVALLDGASFRDYPTRVRLTNAVRNASSAHFDHLEKLLALEADAERIARSRATQNSDGYDGTAITKLMIQQEDLGLGGRLLLTLTRGKQPQVLPANRLQPGAPVVLLQTGVPRPVSVRGVLSERNSRSVVVALDDLDTALPDDAIWRIDLSPDELSRQRQVAALRRVASASGDRLSQLRDLLLGQRPPKFGNVPFSEVKTTLNRSQREAVQFALSANDLALIHGPPGTGKTTTLVALIAEIVAQGGKVLASAPSNAAVDHLLAKLLEAGLLPVRIGHPARIAEELRDRALDALVEKHPDARQARKFAREAQALFRQADKWTRNKPLPGEKQALRSEARDLLAIARRAEQTAVERILASANVICGTLTGLDAGMLGLLRFDVAIIDEACQSTEPACWIPMLRADKVILAGDPCQLPPTVISDDAAEQGLAVSLMERAMALHGATASRLLNQQYRMHAHIMGFSNTEFYNSELFADNSVAAHTLADRLSVPSSTLTATPLLFLDTAGAGHDEENDGDSGSKLNRGEAKLVVQYVNSLLKHGVFQEQIAVIAPYSAQVRLLRELLHELAPHIEIDSVDGFQGQERDVIIFSFVRSNVEGDIGFLSELRRTNVALTRAKRKLILIGDSSTLSHHDFYRRLIEYTDAKGAYHSVWDESME